MGSARRPRLPGVTVYARRNKTTTVYVGRYTLPSKQRVAKAAAEHQKVDRNRHRDVRNGRITFDELVDAFVVPPTPAHRSGTPSEPDEPSARVPAGGRRPSPPRNP